MKISCIKYVLPLYLLTAFPVSGAEWTSAQWVWQKQPDGNFSKRSMLLPAHIVGSSKTYYFNLDTGAEISLLFKNIISSNLSLSKIFNNSSRSSVPSGFLYTMNYGFIVNGEIAATKFSNKAFLLQTSIPSMKTDIIGLVGLNAFSAPVLTVDYIKDRVALTNDVSEVEDDLPQKISYEKYTYTTGLPAINISTMGKSQGQYILDTGVSISDAVVFDLSSWKKMTGRELSDFRNKKIRDYTLGRFFDCVSAPSLLNIDIGSTTLGKLTIAYCLRDGIPIREKGIDGLIGTPSFFGKAIIIFDTKNQKVGFAFSEEQKK
jgi:hypothetical protein